VIETRRTEQGHEVEMVMSTSVFDPAPTEFQAYVSGLWDMTLATRGCDGSARIIDGLKVEQLRPGAANATCPDPWMEK
jgi:hypothetical protein